jgi:hypothetical protein
MLGKHLSELSPDQRPHGDHEGQAGRHAARKRKLATRSRIVVAFGFIGSLLTILASSLQIIALEASAPTAAQANQPASVSPKFSRRPSSPRPVSENGPVPSIDGTGKPMTQTTPPPTSQAGTEKRRAHQRPDRPGAFCTSSSTENSGRVQSTGARLLHRT